MTLWSTSTIAGTSSQIPTLIEMSSRFLASTALSSAISLTIFSMRRCFSVTWKVRARSFCRLATSRVRS